MNLNAIELNQNNKIFYITSMRVSDLIKSSFISRADENNEVGFQRHLNEARAKLISNYLKDGRAIPSPLILSAQPTAKIKFNGSTGKLSISKAEKSLLVIDGQHRLYGYSMLFNEHKTDLSVPVIIFTNLSVPDEIDLFIDINTNQKGVSSSLLLHIKAMSNQSTSLEEKIAYLFKEMNKAGPIAGCLSATKTEKSKISRKLFSDMVKNVVDRGALSNYDLDIHLKSFNNYFSAVELVLEKSKTKKSITSALIFRSFMENILDVIDISISRFGNLKIDSLYSVLEQVSSISFDQYTGTNLATVKQLSTKINSLLARGNRLTTTDAF